MKKNSFMVKNMFMSMLTAGIFATAFTACHDDDFDPKGFNNGPKAESFELTNLEQYSYTVPVQVNVEGDWEIEFKFNNEYNHFCYALPNKGHGPQTIKLCMLDNWTESRNEGHMIIHDLSNNKNDQSFRLMQKCNLDNPKYMAFRGRTRGEGDATEEKKEEEAPVKNQGDIVTAVGYGYNVNVAPGVRAISSRPIIALEALREAGETNKANYGPVFRKGDFSINVETYAGSSIEEISNTMSSNATLKGTRAGFNAEASATFTNTQKSGSSNIFCMTVANVNVGQAMLQGLDHNNFQKYMTEDAKNAINGTGSAYQTGSEGFKQLIKDYGSHLIIRTDLGGRLRYGATIDRKYCSNTNELKAHASMNYKNKQMEANAKASDEYKSTYQKNKSHISINVSAAGGSLETAAALAANDTTQNVDAWIASLRNQENLAVINFSSKGVDAMEMWPLYELIDRNAKGGEDRYNKLKAYMENGQMALDFYEGTTTYNQGEAVRLTFPTDWTKAIEGVRGSSLNNLNGSLIREARYQGKTVAWFCMEYIPSINSESMIPVVYPVHNNKPNFQAGRFLGTKGYRACDISWNSNGTCNVSNQAADKGFNPELYLYANNLYIAEPFANIETPQVRDLTLTAPKMNGDVNITLGLASGWNSIDESWIGKDKTSDYAYPLVKVGTRVWTRENYNGKIPHGKNEYNRHGTHVENGDVYYTYSSLKNAPFPSGWHAGRIADYEELKAVMSNDGEVHQFLARMQESGTSGFNMDRKGWFTYDEKFVKCVTLDYDKHFYSNYKHCGNGTKARLLLPDKGQVEIEYDCFNIVNSGPHDFAMPIRLVMDM